MKRILKLEKALQKIYTHPIITKLIINEVKRYYKIFTHVDNINSSKLKLDTKLCPSQQLEIRWNHFIRGRISKQFKKITNAYYKRNKLCKKKYSGDFWTKSTIK